MIEATKKELQAIARLQKAIDKMPDTLWLFNTGTMCVMKKKEDGSLAYTKSGGVDQAYMIGSIDRIISEGGDW